MNTVIPRNDPGSQAMTQDNVVKQPCYMPTADNAQGNQSGETTLISGTGQSAPFAPPANEINISASTENLSAKYKNGAQDVPADARNQYQ